MILLDSLYINDSGGLVLLEYLVETLEQETNGDVFYLFDHRCEHHFHHIPTERKTILSASLINRYLFYKKNKTEFTKVLCFGNLPPQIKPKCVSYTYFHNINLINIPSSTSFKVRLLSLIKKNIISNLKGNTDFWVVQTDYTQSLMCDFLNIDDSKIIKCPFYKLEESEKKSISSRNDYVYISNYTKQKNHCFLIRVWDRLATLGYFPVLHLTLSKFPQDLSDLIEKCKSKGGNIINHGYISKKEVNELLLQCKATIYPSQNESFGLGIIEALSAGCDLIGPDLPYIHTITNPSEVFDLQNINSAVDAVIKYEKGKSAKSVLKTKDEIKYLINILTK